MAANTLLNAVTGDTVSAGVAITGDVDFSAFGDAGGGVCEIQRAVADVEAEYQPIGAKGRLNGAGHVSVRNVGTNFYRAVLKKCTRTASFTVKSNQ